MTDELKAIIQENLAELEKVYTPKPGRKQSEFADGFKEGYKSACAHILGVLAREHGSTIHPHVLLGQRVEPTREPNRGR